MKSKKIIDTLVAEAQKLWLNEGKAGEVADDFTVLTFSMENNDL